MLERLLPCKQFFVSPAGNKDNPGTLAQPKRTVMEGIALLGAGGCLNLRAGTYVEPVDVHDLHGSWFRPIVIRSHPGEHAIIDASVPQFRQKDNSDWEPAPNGHGDEFRSTHSFPRTLPGDAKGENLNRGAFLDLEPYTRLITYSNINDLRTATNETFEQLPTPDPNRPGPERVIQLDENTPLGYALLDYWYPWVYMGPGIYFDEVSRRVHIRLSHTHNNIDGLPDYDGETDPRRVRLALSRQLDRALTVSDSSGIQFRDLSLRFGGEQTLFVTRSSNVVFDHVRILGGSRAVRLNGGNVRTTFRHCEVRGGVPTWSFRNDRKDEYHFLDAAAHAGHNELGKHTSGVLFSGDGDDDATLIHNCEFLDGHDLYLFGNGSRFHHNWIHNLNDDALAVDAVEPTEDTRLSQNVITQCLTAISYGSEKHVSGQCYIYRNLIDLRSPTAGTRPRHGGDKNVFRQGQFYKRNGVDGPLDLFQNTCLVLAPGALMPPAESASAHAPSFENVNSVSFGHHGLSKGGRRRSFNNVFVAVNPYGEADTPIAFLPSPTFPGPTDGNCYFRVGHAGSKLLRLRPYPDPQSGPKPGGDFGLDDYRASPAFGESKAQYPPGYEVNSKNQDPLFRSIGPDGRPRPTDDLRLRAAHTGIALPLALRILDPLAPGFIPFFAPRPEVGCYASEKPDLRVGVDGRKNFPAQ